MSDRPDSPRGMARAQQERAAHLTRHAQERGRERMGLPHGAMQRMASRALAEGITHRETTGSLRRWLDRQHAAYGNVNSFRIHGEQLYVFTGIHLVTVMQVPRQLRAGLAKLRRHRSGKGDPS